jgi:hypothetical protein
MFFFIILTEEIVFYWDYYYSIYRERDKYLYIEQKNNSFFHFI